MMVLAVVIVVVVVWLLLSVVFLLLLLWLLLLLMPVEGRKTAEVVGSDSNGSSRAQLFLSGHLDRGEVLLRLRCQERAPANSMDESSSSSSCCYKY